MKPILYKTPKAFSNRRVSTGQAISILSRNGIQIDEEQAKIILDFLYLIAKTVPKDQQFAMNRYDRQVEIEPLKRDLVAF